MRGRNYTFVRVEQKLPKIRSRFGDNGNTQNQLLEYGYSCLVGLGDDVEEQIELRIQNLETEIHKDGQP